MRPQSTVQRGLRLATALALLLALVPAAEATNGYFTHGYGTKSKGLAGAGAAFPQEVLIAGTNPAGLAFLGKRYEFGVAVFNPNRSYTVEGNPSGLPGTFGLVPGTVESDSEYFYIPHLGANWELGGHSTLGFVLYGHGGMNTDYPFATFYAGEPTGVNLEQLFVGVPWAYRFGEKHAFSIMPVFAYQRFEAQGVASFAPFSSDPPNLSNNGTDASTGYGAKVGYMGRWFEKFSFGASYQTEMSMGEFDDYAGLFAEQGGFDIPSSWTAGIAVHPTEAFTFVLDLQRVNYSDVKSVGNPFLPNLQQARLGDDEGAGFGWEDMDILKLGLQYDPDNSWAWRVGFSTGSQPIPGSEVLFNILAPGVMEEHFTLGFTWLLGQSSGIDVSFLYAPEVTVAGPNPLEAPVAQAIDLKMDQFELEISYSWGFR